MPTKLKQLKVTSVDFVDAGANPGAKISIFKSASEQTEFKKFCAMIAKNSGVDEDTISKVLTTVVTQDAINTNQPILKISEKHIEQNTPENNSSKIDKADDKGKGDPIPDSPEDSADKEVDEKFSDLADKETEEKKVGKQLTDTEKLILKNFAASDYDKTEIAKCLGFNVSLSNSDGTLTVSAGAADENKPADVQSSDVSPDVSLVDAEKCGGVKKGANYTDEIKKSAEQTETPSETQQTPTATGLTKILADLTDRLQNKIEKAEDKEFEEVAKKYEILGYKAEELAKELKKGKKESPDLYDTVIKALDSAVEAVEKSDMFSEVGKRGTGFTVNAEAQVEQMAAEIRKNNPNISYHKSRDMVFQQHPELIEAFDN